MACTPLQYENQVLNLHIFTPAGRNTYWDLYEQAGVLGNEYYV